MALSPDALTTLESVKEYLQITGPETDSLLGGLIEAISSQFNNYTGRNLAARDYSPRPQDAAYDPDNAVLSGSGHPELILPQYPVLTLSSLVLGGTELAAFGSRSAYVLDRSAGVVALVSGVFARGRGNVSLTYRAGFGPIPAELAQACVEQTASRFQESFAGQGRLGISARTLADGSISYSAKALLPQVTEVLDRFRNRSVL